MKLKLLAFAFILAFAISTFGALGVSGASAGLTTLTIEATGTPITLAPQATGGWVTSFTQISANTGAFFEHIDVDFTC